MIIIDERIVGQWKDGNKNGRGIYTWPNSDRYERASSKIMFNTFMILISTSDMANDHH